jgi:hypothetical protein
VLFYKLRVKTVSYNRSPTLEPKNKNIGAKINFLFTNRLLIVGTTLDTVRRFIKSRVLDLTNLAPPDKKVILGGCT